MPLYEYECSKCGRIEEVLQSFSDKPLKKCRHCNGKLHKLISQSSFHLKGTGWYVTDYAGKRGQNAQAKTDSAGSGKEAKSSATSDSAGSKSASDTRKT
jgi:putative FmdB family regulatory protein